MTDIIPSWNRWPPNCCETCTGWEPSQVMKYIGKCNSSESLEVGQTTDSRYRCPAFKRRPGV